LEAAPAIAEAPTAIAPSTASAITPDRTLLNINSSFDRSSIGLGFATAMLARLR
jgi:hypothetical protein